MKKHLLLFVFALTSFSMWADVAERPFYEKGIPGTLIYSAVGILIALLAFKVIDWITPGKLSKQITEEKNVALAIVTGALILGICIIVAAAISG